MRFLHLSDLHIGKSLNNHSLLNVQDDILQKILAVAEDKKPNAIFICGDVYDKGIPSESAVKLFDKFIVALSRLCKPIFIISGNHDSAERIAFANELLKENGVYISPVYTKRVEPIAVKDEYGEVDIYMLPFVKPSAVKSAHGEDGIDSYTSAIKCAIDNMGVREDRRSVLLAHQFVSGASKSGSEETMSLGGLDNVDSSVFKPFCYTALGHIHRAQNVGFNKRIRYCGTPLKYSASEADDIKTITLGELDGEGKISIEEIPLTPLTDLITLEGSFDELTSPEFTATVDTEAYVYVTLTDSMDRANAFNRLRTIYHNIMSMKYARLEIQHDYNGTLKGADTDSLNDPVKIFTDFYNGKNEQTLTDAQQAYIKAICEELKNDKE